MSEYGLFPKKCSYLFEVTHTHNARNSYMTWSKSSYLEEQFIRNTEFIQCIHNINLPIDGPDGKGTLSSKCTGYDPNLKQFINLHCFS